jgi:hypothetical protein
MTKASYEADFYAWTQAQAQALRARQWNAVDLNNVVEEIESLGKEQEHAVESHLSDLLMHLLKWMYQPKRRCRSWRSSITNARQQLARRLRRNPSLRSELPTFLPDAYADARRLAADETGLSRQTFPEACPWSLAQLQDPDFWPEVVPISNPKRSGRSEH